MSEENFLKEKDVCVLLGISRSTLYRLRMENGFPHQNVGEKLVRYRLSEIENWLDNYGKSTPLEEKVNEKRDDEMPEEKSQVPAATPRVAAIFKPKSGVFMK